MIVFHHNDLDGRCSAAIIHKHYKHNLSFIELDYKDRVPFEKVHEDELVYIVDFSLKPEDMNELLKITKGITWIDHHKTASEYPYQNLKGLRNFKDKEESGCELTWRYLFQPKPMPKAVKLIGDYDKWLLKYDPDCFYFTEGMKMFDNAPFDSIWNVLLSESLEENEIEKIIRCGKTAINYRDNYCKEMRNSFGYEIELAGYKGYACNIYKFGSQGFGKKMTEYDFVASYVHDGKNFMVSLYSEKIDVGSICKDLGGGGHTGAAGFTSNNLPF